MEGELIMSTAGQHGVTKNTPKNIPFGSGTIHKGLKYTEGSGWNFAETLCGATNGGSKIAIVPEYYDVPLDGVGVLVKGLKKKIGEKGTMDVNFAELTPEIIKAAAHAMEGVSEDELYTLLESKSDIEEGDYWENIAFVGETLDGRKIIAIMDNSFCTSGFNHEGKSKESATGAYTFECHADLEAIEMNCLPWHIYYPLETA